jgi:peptide/nickel transport system permease protein
MLRLPTFLTASRHRVSGIRLPLPRLRASTVGFAIVLGVVLVGLIGPILSPYDPLALAPAERLRPPGSPGHPLGTDNLGRDMLTRLMVGARLSLVIGAIPVIISIPIGLLIGLVAGYFGGWVDAIISRLLDIWFAFPTILLAIAIVAVLGPGIVNAIIAIAFTAIPTQARVVRGPVLSLREQDFVLAARVIGADSGRILWRHITPNILTPLIVLGTLELGTFIIFGAGLSFLGLGAQPPEAEWGLMLAEGRGVLSIAPHVAVLPGLAIFLVVISLQFVGDGVRDFLDPRTRKAIAQEEDAARMGDRADTSTEVASRGR